MSRHRQVRQQISRREWEFEDDYDYDHWGEEEEAEEHNPYSYYNRDNNNYDYNNNEDFSLDELHIQEQQKEASKTLTETPLSAHKTQHNDIVKAVSSSSTKTKKATTTTTATTKKKKNSNSATTSGSKTNDKVKPTKKTKKKNTNTNATNTEGKEKRKNFKKATLTDDVIASRVCDSYTIVVIGHVDAGKSTVVGHLLYKQGHVDERAHMKNKREAQKLGKQSFEFAFMMDEHGSERERGVTINVGQKQINTPTKRITVLDAPGHQDFVPNMITGAAHADSALLVVDASPGEFESGFDDGGQTREHVLLVRSLGIGNIVVAVNKMDNIHWDQERYNSVCERLKDFFQQCGFSKKKIQFVPISGYFGHNLIVKHTDEEATWYKGSTLIDVLDTLSVNERDVSQPLRVSVSDTFKRIGQSALYVCGRVIAGYVCLRDDVIILPNNEIGTVKEITIGDSNTVEHAFAGDTITLAITNVEEERIRAGDLLCHPQSTPQMANRIKCKIVMFDTKLPLLHGTHLMLHHQQESTAAVVHLVQQLNKKTMNVEKEQPRVLTRNMVGVVDVELDDPLCVEPVSVSKDLARVLFRLRGATIAGGVALEASMETRETSDDFDEEDDD
eukprot:m.148216 g.148216  ORF g.148216 m.148216 type:complete len:616 (-) comp13250_c0_seq5:165-2012(-)